MKSHANTQLHTRLVAAGVDGSQEGLAAARYAVHAADVRGLDVLLVHAYELPPLNTPVDESMVDACHRLAQKLVDDTAAVLVTPPAMKIEALVDAEVPSTLLERVAHDVPLLVVGQDHRGWGERLLFGRVASHVGQNADCPVVVVPTGWQVPSSRTHQPVVVAVSDSTNAEGPLRMAMLEAQAMCTQVVVIHACPYTSPATDLAQQEGVLTDMLARWVQDSPDVTVTTSIVRGDADANLVRLSHSASLLVLGRHHRHGWAHLTHSVLRAVIKQTHCPLAVVPEDSTQPNGH